MAVTKNIGMWLYDQLDPTPTCFLPLMVQMTFDYSSGVSIFPIPLLFWALGQRGLCICIHATAACKVATGTRH